MAVQWHHVHARMLLRSIDRKECSYSVGLLTMYNLRAACSCEVKVESEAKLKLHRQTNHSTHRDRAVPGTELSELLLFPAVVLSLEDCYMYVDLDLHVLYVLTVSRLPAAREVESALACMQPAFHCFILSINLIYFLFSISLPASMRKALLSPFRLVTFRALRSSSAAASSMLTPAFAARTMAK